MTIQIRQLQVKSSVVQRACPACARETGGAGGEGQGDAKGGEGGMKEEILAECRRMVLDLLRSRKER